MSTLGNNSSQERVRILCTSGDAPLMVEGELTQSSDVQLTVRGAPNAAELSVGDRVILDFPHSERERVTGAVQDVTAVDDGGYDIAISDGVSRQRDKRDFPRLYAGLPIRYQVVADAECSDGASRIVTWVGGGDAQGGDWHTPDPFMNFSIGGLRFEGLRSLEEGTTLLIDLALDAEGQRWQIAGKVIRIWPPEEEEAQTRPVAIAFEHLPEDAREALSDLTLRIQETLL